MHRCATCLRQFVDTKALRTHQETVGHGYLCSGCTRRCPTEAGLKSHHKAAHEVPCPDCEEVFASKALLKQHKKTSGHCYCQPCNRIFVNVLEFCDHKLDFVHVQQFHCCDCDRDFVSEKALTQHLADKIHAAPPPPVNPLECLECRKVFRNERAIEQHRASLVHNPISDIRCPASATCGKTFASFSGLILHLESGGCPNSGINREVLNTAVLVSDSDRLISSPALLLDAADENEAASETNSTNGSFILYTPDSSTTAGVALSPGPLTPSSSSSSTALIPRNPLSCALCQATRRPFRTARDLEQHLASPFHEARVFHCPVSLFGEGAGAVKTFKTLSGLAQHLESGACGDGMDTLRRAVQEVEGRLRGMGIKWEGMKLLL